MPSNHLILSHPLLPLPSVFSNFRVFSSESVLPIRGPKYWSISFSISPSNEYSGLISFRIDRFDLPAVQGTPKSLFQHQSLKSSTLWCSAFFMVQLSWKGRKIIYAEGRKAAVRWKGVCIATSIKMRLSSQYKLGRDKVDQILTSSDNRMRAGKLSDEQPKQYMLEMNSKGLKVRLYRTTKTIWCHFYVESKIWHKWTYLWNRLTDTENRLCGCQGEEGGDVGMDWEFGFSRGKLLYIEWINNKVLLYRTGNYIQYPVISHKGKEYEKLCI